MKILADKNILYVYKLFGLNNQVQICEGRIISHKDLRCINVLIVRSVTKVNHMLLRDSCVEFVGTATSGTDHVDKNYLKKNKIKFADAAGSNAISVVEYVLSALFWLAKRDHFFLRDKTVGIIGVGNIGNLLYHKLSSLGVNTLLCDPYISKTNIDGSWKSLEKLVSESDILTFHTPLTYTGKYPTWHMVNIDVLDAVPDHSILINTSRGEVFDNSALLKVLKYKKKISVVLDVWESEPYLLLPLLSYVDIGTAHIAGYTLESKIRNIIYIYNKYCDYFNIKNPVYTSCLFPDIAKNVYIKRLDEMHLSHLISFVYDIYRDHLALQSYALRPGGFDILRNHYGCARREWSSLLVKTKKDCSNELLKDLGFNVL